MYGTKLVDSRQKYSGCDIFGWFGAPVYTITVYIDILRVFFYRAIVKFPVATHSVVRHHTSANSITVERYLSI